MSEVAALSEIFSSIQGEGPLVGVRQAFVRFHGCRLGCAYCDTVAEEPEACRVESNPGEGDFRLLLNPVKPEAILAHLLRWKQLHPRLHHSVSVTGGEPLEHSAFLQELLPPLSDIFPVFLETNGVLPAELEKVIGSVEYVSADIKLPSTSGLADLWEIHRDFLRIASSRKLFVKIVVGTSTTEGEVEMAASLVQALDTSIPFILQPLTTADSAQVPSAPRLLALHETAARLLENVRVIPQTHRFLDLL